MSGLSHFTHYLSLWLTKGKLDDLTASNRMPKQSLFSCWQEQTAQGLLSIFEPCIYHRLLFIINSLIKALISSWVQLSASNQVWFTCSDRELSLATCWRRLWHKWASCRWPWQWWRILQFQTDWHAWTYLWVEVGHFGNAGRILLSTGISGTDIQHTGCGIERKVHERTRDIELLVDDLYNAEERR